MKERALVVLSGGQDSSTCLAVALTPGMYEEVRAVTFDYGQRHAIEVTAAARMIGWLATQGITVQHEIVQVPGILRGTSPLVNSAAQVEQYASADVLPGGLEKTFVPMRNALFLTIAANRAAVWAAESGSEVSIYTGVSQEDYGGYPDCRLPFVSNVSDMIASALDEDLPLIYIETPLIHLNKAQTVKLAESLPYGRELNALSRTCYNGVFPPCGNCHACLLRERGYKEAGVKDPALEVVAA